MGREHLVQGQQRRPRDLVSPEGAAQVVHILRGEPDAHVTDGPLLWGDSVDAHAGVAREQAPARVQMRTALAPEDTAEELVWDHDVVCGQHQQPTACGRAVRAVSAGGGARQLRGRLLCRSARACAGSGRAGVCGEHALAARLCAGVCACGRAPRRCTAAPRSASQAQARPHPQMTHGRCRWRALARRRFCSGCRCESGFEKSTAIHARALLGSTPRLLHCAR